MKGKEEKRSYFNDRYLFNKLNENMQKRYQCRISNKKSIDIIRDIEMLKIKLIDIENYLEAKDIYQIVNYLSLLSYQSNLPNFVFEKPEKESFWMTIWKYQDHSSEKEIIVKISYRRDAYRYNPRTNYHDSNYAYSPCVYTESNILVNYFMDYIFPILTNRDKNIINPLKFI